MMVGIGKWSLFKDSQKLSFNGIYGIISKILSVWQWHYTVGKQNITKQNTGVNYVESLFLDIVCTLVVSDEKLLGNSRFFCGKPTLTNLTYLFKIFMSPECYVYFTCLVQNMDTGVTYLNGK